LEGVRLEKISPANCRINDDNWVIRRTLAVLGTAGSVVAPEVNDIMQGRFVKYGYIAKLNTVEHSHFTLTDRQKNIFWDPAPNAITEERSITRPNNHPTDVIWHAPYLIQVNTGNEVIEEELRRRGNVVIHGAVVNVFPTAPAQPYANGRSVIWNEGCLFMAHLVIAQKELGTVFTAAQIVDIYYEARRNGYITGTIFLQNGIALLNMVFMDNRFNPHSINLSANVVRNLNIEPASDGRPAQDDRSYSYLIRSGNTRADNTGIPHHILYTHRHERLYNSSSLQLRRTNEWRGVIINRNN
ncbi:MAG: hypothetical protein FWE37_02085, partial [Spirochaetaceae bacterium]|nr:hypothetical protein [Spirochaetaceae bacterium]